MPAATAIIALIAAPPASALLSLTAGPGSVLSPFDPGKTAAGTGALTATDTNASWALQAEDLGAGAGRMIAGTTGCTGSDHTLTNRLSVSITSSLGGVSAAGAISLSGANQTVASATNQTLASAVLTTNYSLAIPPSETMVTGCVYSITVTYTLQ